ncbi:MAG: hypothetical protein RRC34_01625 [Lentisphaeria bacterium]|nr:hypothetical protein [Lentisphaeria bacterium]
MIYSENTTTHKRAMMLIAVAVLCVYMVPMGVFPVRESEARLSLMANRRTWDSSGKHENFLHGKSPFMVLHHALYRGMTPGADGPTAFYAPRDTSSSRGLALPALAPRRALWSVRLLSLLALALLALPCVWTVKRELSGGAAIVTVGVISGALPVMALCHVDTRSVFLAGLINAAWFSWYFLARQRKSWDQAWAVSGMFLLIACLEGGSLMLVVFYGPLLFLRRPFRIWQRMLNPVHLVSLGAILIFSIFWAHFSRVEDVLRLMGGMSVEVSGQQSVSFLVRLVVIPIGVILMLTPWPAIIWPAYCAAFKPLEKNAVFAHFLRTLVAPLFLVIWFVAGMRGLLVLLMVPALAALGALNYELLVRRHIRRLRQFARGFRRVVMVTGCVTLVFWIAHALGLPRFAGVRAGVIVWSLGFFILGMGWCALNRFSRNRLPFWGELLAATTGLACLAQSLILPLGDVVYRDAAADAAALMMNVPPDAPVYVLPASDIIRPAFNSQRHVIQIPAAEYLPAGEPVVYVWGNGRAPLLETRKWEKVSDPLPRSRGEKLTCGVSTEESARLFKFVCGWTPDVSRDNVNQIYRGVIDPESQRLLTP